MDFWSRLFSPAGFVPRRQRAEQQVRDMNAQLEERVHERTKELEASSARFGAIVKASSHIIWVRDPQGHFSATQESWSAFTGQSFGEYHGGGWLKAIHPDHRERVSAAWQQAIKTPELYQTEYLLRRHDGEFRHMEVRSVPVADENGSIREWVGTSTDVTERKRNELDLQHAQSVLATRSRFAFLSADVAVALTREASLRETLHQCAEALVRHLDAAFARIWTLDESGKVLELQASAGMYTHLDGPHSRVPVGQFKIGMIAEERQPHLTNQVRGDPRVSDQEWAQREGMVAFAGYPLIVDNHLVGVIAAFARRPLTGEALQAMESVADVVSVGIQRKKAQAERSQSDARKTAILQSALDCIIGIDAQSNILEWNPASEKTFGYSREEAIGASLCELIIPPTLRAAHYEGMRRYLTTGEAPILNQRIEVQAMRRGGEEFPVELAITRIESDGASHFIAYLRDITLRKQAEIDLQRARDAAETANKTKSLFLANMSHELRTPLNAILGYSEMLQEEAEDGEWQNLTADLGKINASGKHLLTLINDILDLSKIEAGKMELFLEEFVVEEVIVELAETVRPLLENNRNSLLIDCARDLGETHGDLTKMRQSLLNLLSNAAKFSSDGTVLLKAWRESMDGRDWICLSVRDEGIGMSADQLIKLFRPFTQGDASTTRKFGGTGLGLALTRRFCQMMGGDVTITSSPGKGSTFTIKVPADVEAAGDTLLQAVPSSEPGHATDGALEGRQPGQPATSLSDYPSAAAASTARTKAMEVLETVLPARGTAILVIDDDQTQLDIMRHFISQQGFTVVTAQSGAEGLELARRLQPIAITLDVMMPQVDGWSVLSALKSDPDLKEVPVIMLTMVDDKEQGTALGADDFVTKPINRERLRQLLQALK